MTPADSGASAPKKRNRRLTKAGTTILEEYIKKHDDTHPSTKTMESLLDLVKRAQDDNEIPLKSINSWFQRKRTGITHARVTKQQQEQQPEDRQHEGRQQQTSQGSSRTSIPSYSTTPFTDETLNSLQTLVDSTPNPGPQVLDVWASLFKVTRTVLEYAIQVVLPQHFSRKALPPTPSSPGDVKFRILDSPDALRRSRLPTPSDTTPEPDQSPISHSRQLPRLSTPFENHATPIPQMQMSPPPTPPVPPRVPKGLVAAQEEKKYSEEQEYVEESTIDYQSMKEAILGGVADACGIPARTTTRPNSAATFNKLFQSHYKNLGGICIALDNNPPEHTQQD